MYVSRNYNNKESWLVLESCETLEDAVSQVEVDNDYDAENIEINDDITYQNLDCFDELVRQYTQEGLIGYYYGEVCTRQGILTVPKNDEDDYIIYIKLIQPFEFYKYHDPKNNYVEFYEQDAWTHSVLDFDHTDDDFSIYRKYEYHSQKFDYGFGCITTQFIENLMNDDRFSYNEDDKKWIMRNLEGIYTKDNILPYLKENHLYKNNSKVFNVKYLTPETIKR